MKVDWSEPIAGVPKLQVRNFMRRAGSAPFPESDVAEWFDISEQDAATLIKELLNRGWIEPSDALTDLEAEPLRGYTVAKSGLRICATTAKARIPRTKADKIMAAFMDRVREVNSRDELPHVVKQVRLFGSYLKGAEEVGDIDLVVDLGWRHPDRDVIKEALARANASGKHFRSFINLVGYSEIEVMRLLKARNPYLSFHAEHELKATGARTKVIFPET